MPKKNNTGAFRTPDGDSIDHFELGPNDTILDGDTIALVRSDGEVRRRKAKANEVGQALSSLVAAPVTEAHIVRREPIFRTKTIHMPWGQELDFHYLDRDALPGEAAIHIRPNGTIEYVASWSVDQTLFGSDHVIAPAEGFKVKAVRDRP